MSEFCPASSGNDRIPDFCMQECQERWEQAVSKNEIAETYDTYNHYEPLEKCCLSGEIQAPRDAIAVTGEFQRTYTIVDECASCGTELGEQKYKFICPNPAENN